MTNAGITRRFLFLASLFVGGVYGDTDVQAESGQFPRTDHPRLYFTETDLPALRELRTGGVHRRIWQNLTHWADWCAAQPPRQHWIPTLPDDPIYENLYDRFYGAMHDMAIVEHLAFAAALSDEGDDRYVEPAIEWTITAASVWGQEANNSPDASKAYAVLRIMKALAVSYDLLYHRLSRSQRKTVRDAIVPVCDAYFRFFQTTMKDGDGYNKHHASVDAPPLGVAALALLGEVDEANDWLDLALEKHTDLLLPHALTPSGTNDQSSNFWASSLQYRIFFLDALHRVTGRDLLQEFPRALPGRIALAAVTSKHPADLEFGRVNGNILLGPSYGQLNYWSPVLLYLARREQRPIYQRLALWDETLGGLQRSRYRTPNRGEELLFSFGGYAYLWYDASVTPAVEKNVPLSFEFPEPSVNEVYLRSSFEPGHLAACMKKGSLVIHAGGRPVLVDQFNADEVNNPSKEVEQLLLADDGRWARIRCVGPAAYGIGEQIVDLDRPGRLTIHRRIHQTASWWFAGAAKRDRNELTWSDGTRLRVTHGKLGSVDEDGYLETKTHFGGMKFADPQPQAYSTVKAEPLDGLLEIVITTSHSSLERSP